MTSLLQGYPGEKGVAGPSDIIDFNGKLLDAIQVSDIKASMRTDLKVPSSAPSKI